MPSFGGYGGIFPIRFGGAKPVVQTITEALGDARGTAYDVETDSPVWVENHATARALTTVWRANELLANQFDPRRMTVLLERWELILGLPSNPALTAVQRRKRVLDLWNRTGATPTFQQINDRLSTLLSPVTFTIIQNNPGDAGVISSWPDGWYLQSLGTTPPAVTLIGKPVANLKVQIDIVTGGIIGAATVRYSIDSGTTFSPAVITSSSLVIGTTGLTAYFPAGTYNADNLYTADVYSDTFTSTVGRILIAASRPSWMPFPDFYEKLKGSHGLLNDFLPAWVGFTVGYIGPSGAGIFLDEPGALDGEYFP